jgi:N-methylhydantoinase B
MRTVIIRTAYSRMIIEGHDFSSAVLTPEGDLVPPPSSSSRRTSPRLSWSAARVIAKYGGDLGPAICSCTTIRTPAVASERRGPVLSVFRASAPLAIVGVMAHWQDIGGMVPGSISRSAKDIYQEGIRIPSLRIARRGCG